MIDVHTWWNTQEANWKNLFNIVLGPAERGYHIKAFESSNCWMEVVHINGGLSVSKVVPRLIFRPPIQFHRLNPETHSVLTVEQEKGSIFSDRKSFSPWSYFFLTNFMLSIPSLYIQLFPCRNLDSLWKPRTTLSWQCHTESLLVAISFYHHHKHLSADNCSLIVAKK